MTDFIMSFIFNLLDRLIPMCSFNKQCDKHCKVIQESIDNITKPHGSKGQIALLEIARDAKNALVEGQVIYLSSLNSSCKDIDQWCRNVFLNLSECIEWMEKFETNCIRKIVLRIWPDLVQKFGKKLGSFWEAFFLFHFHRCFCSDAKDSDNNTRAIERFFEDKLEFQKCIRRINCTIKLRLELGISSFKKLNKEIFLQLNHMDPINPSPGQTYDRRQYRGIVLHHLNNIKDLNDIEINTCMKVIDAYYPT